MALVKTIDTKYELQKEFKAYDRDQFSIEGYQAILDYFDSFGDENVELDVIAICCDFNEDRVEDIRDNYNIPEDEDVLEYLDSNTYAMYLDNGSILYIIW